MNKAVIGLAFGDEGKGTVVDMLSTDEIVELVVRFSGGQQVGHTVYTNDKSHTFSNFGSGTLQNIPTYWSQFCTVDPFGFYNERLLLTKAGLSPKIYYHPDCPLTTPFDKRHNQKNDIDNGTCGTGYGSTIQREEDYYHLKVRDYFFPEIFKYKFKAIADYYKVGNMHTREEYESYLKHMEYFVRHSFVEEIKNLHRKNVVYEGSQGLLLDQHYGFFPNVTRSNTGLKNVMILNNNEPVITYLVTRTYITRHGNGPMPSQEIEIIPNPFEINTHNKFQGKFRKAMLDMDYLRYGYMSDPFISKMPVNLVITHMDAFKAKYPINVGKNVRFCMEREFLDIMKLTFNAEKLYTNNSPHTNTMILRD